MGTRTLPGAVVRDRGARGGSWVGRRAGRSLSWALLPAELVFWIGFALPIGPVLGAARLLLVRKDFR